METERSGDRISFRNPFGMLGGRKIFEAAGSGIQRREIYAQSRDRGITQSKPTLFCFRYAAGVMVIT